MARIHIIFAGLIVGLFLTGCGVLAMEPVVQTVTPVSVGTGYTTATTEVIIETVPPSITATPMPDPDLIITSTVTDTLASTILADSITPTPTPYSYVLQAGTPARIVNFLYPELGCDWMGVGGQVFGLDNQAQQLVVIKIAGLLGGEEQMHLALTGLSQKFGPGGYEIKLADQPIESTGTLSIQLFDVDGIPISEIFLFDTIGGVLGCEQNLVLINFTEIITGLEVQTILPLIFFDEPAKDTP